MTDLQRERYVSIFSHNAKGGLRRRCASTGVIGDFKVSLRRPLFGHGLGTRRKPTRTSAATDMPSHNLYTETAEELGYVGLVLVLGLIWSFLRACWTAQRVVAPRRYGRPAPALPASAWQRRWSWWSPWTCSSASPRSALGALLVLHRGPFGGDGTAGDQARTRDAARADPRPGRRADARGASGHASGRAACRSVQYRGCGPARGAPHVRHLRLRLIGRLD